MRYSLGHGLLCVVAYISAIETALRVCYGYITAVSAGSITRGDYTVCLLLWLPCQAGENKHVYSSYGSLSFLPASLLTPCIPWVQ